MDELRQRFFEFYRCAQCQLAFGPTKKVLASDTARVPENGRYAVSSEAPTIVLSETSPDAECVAIGHFAAVTLTSEVPRRGCFDLVS